MMHFTNLGNNGNDNFPRTEENRNGDGIVVTASPRTINVINAQCTGKGSQYAISPKVAIKPFDRDDHENENRIMSAPSALDKEQESNSHSLQGQKTAKKDQQTQKVTDAKNFSRPLVLGKSTSAIEKGKALVSAASKFIFDVV